MRHLLLLLILLLVALPACQPNTPTPNTIAATTPAPTPTFAPATSGMLLSGADAVNNLPPIKVGQKLSEIETHDVKGKPLILASRSDAQGELIVVYAPGCHVCHATVPRIITLYNGFFQKNNIPVIGVSVQNKLDTQFSIQEMSIPFRVTSIPDIDKQMGLYIQNVPTMIAVGPDGVIKGLWVGMLEPEQLTQIIKTFCPTCNVQVNQNS